ncbi:MAG: Gfo/Idh/MocA family oxidoreductase [Clostridia bacterium]|nr:Gfo/Idh/MocA family oxidoreductase [Clostridia bacterium]
MKKVVICGVWHVHAPDYYNYAHDLVDIIGVYDEDPIKLAAFCEKFPVKPFASFEELLASGADGAIVCISTESHADVMVALANAKMDIFTEKVLGLTTAECERVEEAVNRNGVKFVISFPRRYSAGALTVKKIVDSGVLGKINYFRYHASHNGSCDNWLPAHFYNRKECGGGAMIDHGAHGMYLVEWFCGMPDAAYSAFTVACEREDALALNPDRVEDNSVTVMTYKNGCIAINESGFVSTGYPATIEVCGEKGRVLFDNQKVYIADKSKVLKEVELEEAQPIPIIQFCTGNILEGCGMAEAKKLTKIMEMAYANFIS